MALNTQIDRTQQEGGRTAVATTTVAIAVGACAGLAAEVLTGKMSMGLAAAAAGTFTVGAVASAEVGVYAVLLIAFFDGILKGMSPGWHTVLAKDFFLALTLARWLWDGATGKHRMRSLASAVAVPAFLFMLYCGVEMFNPNSASMKAALAGFRAWVLWIPLFFVAYDVFDTPAKIWNLVIFVAALAAVTAVYGIVQFNIGFDHLQSLGPGFTFYNRFGGVGKHVRATSTLVSPNVFGAAACMSALICLGGVGATDRPLWARVALCVVCAASVVGVATSGSRAPLLSLLVGTATILVVARRGKFVVLAVFIVGSVIGLSTLVPEAFTFRYTGEYLAPKTIVDRPLGPAQDAILAVSKNPLGTGVATGVGMGRGQFLVETDVEIDPEAQGMIENDYGRAFRELGLPGGLLFLLLLYRVLRSATTSYGAMTLAPDRWLAASLVGTLVAGLALLSVGAALYLAPSGPFFYIIGGICAGLPHIREDTNTTDSLWARHTPRAVAPFSAPGTRVTPRPAREPVRRRPPAPK
jgi:hypothetical protein